MNRVLSFPDSSSKNGFIPTNSSVSAQHLVRIRLRYSQSIDTFAQRYRGILSWTNSILSKFRSNYAHSLCFDIFDFVHFNVSKLDSYIVHLEGRHGMFTRKFVRFFQTSVVSFPLKLWFVITMVVIAVCGSILCSLLLVIQKNIILRLFSLFFRCCASKMLSLNAFILPPIGAGSALSLKLFLSGYRSRESDLFWNVAFSDFRPSTVSASASYSWFFTILLWLYSTSSFSLPADVLDLM